MRKITTGFSVGYSDFGNNKSFGSAYSIMPFLHFNISKNSRLSALLSLGTSFFTEEFNEQTNFGNKAITTDFVWSFRGFLFYKLSKRQHASSSGICFFHYSNGHVKLPNQGPNSALISYKKPIFSQHKSKVKQNQYKTMNNLYFFTLQSGLGINALTIPYPFNDSCLVRSTCIIFGKRINTDFKIGLGAYYSFYQDYYDYISKKESLVQEGREFSYLKDNPVWNASALGFSIHGELILNHVAIEAKAGVNVHKPAYKIDKRINQDWYFFPREFEEDSGLPLGELDSE